MASRAPCPTLRARSEALLQAEFDPSCGELIESRTPATPNSPIGSLAIEIECDVHGHACGKTLRHTKSGSDRTERRETSVGRVRLPLDAPLRKGRIVIEIRGTLGVI